jgi:hypothetical protein
MDYNYKYYVSQLLNMTVALRGAVKGMYVICVYDLSVV